jgi:hypothetical protein
MPTLVISLAVKTTRAGKNVQGLPSTTKEKTIMHSCPDCRGEKSAFGLACTMDKGCRPITMVCHFCNGIGVVDAPAFKRWRIGEAMRRARVKRGSSQREQAVLLGISQIVLNDIEHGRANAPACRKCQDPPPRSPAWERGCSRGRLRVVSGSVDNAG